MLLPSVLFPCADLFRDFFEIILEVDYLVNFFLLFFVSVSLFFFSFFFCGVSKSNVALFLDPYIDDDESESSDDPSSLESLSNLLFLIDDD